MAFNILGSGKKTNNLNGVTSDAVDTTGATWIVVGISKYQPNAGTLTDSKVNGWTPLTAKSLPSDNYSQLFVCFNPTVGAGHTFDFAGASTYPALIYIFGNGTLPEFDKEAAGNTNSGGASIQPGSVTPDNANSLLIALCSANSVITQTIDSGFTKAQEIAFGSGNNYGEALFYLIQGAAAAVNPTIGGGATNRAAVMAVFAEGSLPPPDDMVLTGASVINDGQINVAFTEDVDFDTIKLQRDTVNTFDSVNLVEYDEQPADSPFVNNTGLNPTVTTTYYYRAKAKNTDDVYSDNWSNIVSATIELPFDFVIPAEIEASDKLLPENGNLADSFEWWVNGELVSTEAEPELTVFLVMGENTVELKAFVEEVETESLEKTVNVVPKLINVGNVTSYLLEDLTEGLVLTGRVRAVDGAGNQSSWSNTNTAVVGVEGFFLTEDGGDFLTEDGGDFLTVED